MYELMKFGGIVTEKIDAQVRYIEESLGAKSAKNYEEYREQCGVITGLLTARRFITDLTKNMENLDE